ncbi:MAG TPA: peptide chain release factor 1 [Desulfatiglandales bacterium]|nr:peptide chain release factor 1 [Desulfatiglandales bacterium]
MAVQLDKTEERILAKLGELERRYDALESQMSDPAVVNNPNQMSKLAREYGTLKGMVQEYRYYQKLKLQLEDAESILKEEGAEADLRELASEEIVKLREQMKEAIEKAKEELVMSNDKAVDSVFLEIRAGTGGEEAGLFVGDLFRMYTRYAENRGWKVEHMTFSPTDMRGFREVIISIKGHGVWQELGYEGGGHRVQRVPETETQGRIHTSAATVAVLPEPEELEIDIKPDEVIEHVCRASGPGGQNVNKVSSAIKLEHIETGITVSMQEEKSQHKNRAKAWRILRSRVYDYYEQKKRAERDSVRKNMIGSGDRSQRIRTYNFPQNRLTDHRINLSLHSLDKIMMGEMDPLVKGLIYYDKQQRLENYFYNLQQSAGSEK